MHTAAICVINAMSCSSLFIKYVVRGQLFSDGSGSFRSGPLSMHLTFFCSSNALFAIGSEETSTCVSSIVISSWSSPFNYITVVDHLSSTRFPTPAPLSLEILVEYMLQGSLPSLDISKTSCILILLLHFSFV